MAYPKRHFTEEARRVARRQANVRYRARIAAMRPPLPTREERFWSYVDRTGGCWIWTKARNRGGYGVFRWSFDGKFGMHLTHRIAWSLLIGPLNELGILHRCDNPPCVRPDHLFQGNQEANMADAARKDRMGHHGRTRAKGVR